MQHLEVWKRLYYYGYETDYAVSNTAKIYNMKTLKELKHWHDRLGYCRINIYISELRKTIGIPLHRAVALCFCNNPENKREINHIDGNKDNNNSWNLEWCTRSENMKHALKMSLIKKPEALKVLNDELVHKICKMLEEDLLSSAKIAKALGVKKHNVLQIRQGAWSHISSQYNIPKKDMRTVRLKWPRYVPQVEAMLLAGYKRKYIMQNLHIPNITDRQYRDFIKNRIASLKKRNLM